MTTFRCRRVPALSVRSGDRYLKFAGGQLTVEGTDAVAVADFAVLHPEYQITQDIARDAPVTYDRAAMQAALRALGEKTGGTNAELSERLAAAYGEPT